MPGRTAARVDANQGAIVKALRGVGAWVWLLHTVGRGFPDLLVAFRRKLFLLEVKSASGTLTSDEVEWHERYPGVAHVVRTPEEALVMIGAVEAVIAKVREG